MLGFWAPPSHLARCWKRGWWLILAGSINHMAGWAVVACGGSGSYLMCGRGRVGLLPLALKGNLAWTSQPHRGPATLGSQSELAAYGRIFLWS